MNTRTSIPLLGIIAFGPMIEVHAEGWYVFAGGGIAFTENANGAVGDVPFRAGIDTGFIVHGGTGYQFGPYRLEGEMVFAKNPLDSLSLGDARVTAGGNRSDLAGLANFYVDFDTHTRWTPYAGAGIGIANVSFNDAAATPLLMVNDDDTVFVFQVKAGVAYSLGTSTEVSFGYRFFSTDDIELNDTGGTALSVEGTQLHALEAGVRYHF